MRSSGKTVETVLMLARLNRPILVKDEKRKRELLRIAKELDVTIPEPIIMVDEETLSE